MTLFMSKYRYALSLVEIDDDSIPMENYIATKMLCRKLSVYEGHMQACLRASNATRVNLYCGVYVIRNIRLRHGRKFWAEKTRAEKKAEKEQKKSDYNNSGINYSFRTETEF